MCVFLFRFCEPKQNLKCRNSNVHRLHKTEQKSISLIAAAALPLEACRAGARALRDPSSPRQRRGPSSPLLPSPSSPSWAPREEAPPPLPRLPSSTRAPPPSPPRAPSSAPQTPRPPSPGSGATTPERQRSRLPLLRALLLPLRQRAKPRLGRELPPWRGAAARCRRAGAPP